MAEHFYVFIKDNVAEQISVFAGQDNDLAERIVDEQGFDAFIYVDETAPVLYSSYNAKAKTFTPPTKAYLISRGILSEETDSE